MLIHLSVQMLQVWILKELARYGTHDCFRCDKEPQEEYANGSNLDFGSVDLGDVGGSSTYCANHLEKFGRKL